MPDEILLVVMLGAMKLAALGLGALLLLPVLRDDRSDPGGGSDEDGGGSDRRPSRPPRVPGPDDGLPLPDAAPARVRLRDGKRLADLLPAPSRRPQHAPSPEPAPVPERRPIRD